MKLILHSVILILFAVGWLNPVFAQRPSDKSKELEKVFTRLISNRLKALSTGDTAAYRAMLTPDFVHIDDRGYRRTIKELMSMVSENRSKDPKLPGIKYTLSDVTVRRRANIAVAEVTVTETIALGSKETGSLWHESNIYLNTKGNWLLLHHVETPALGRDTSNIKMDSARLAELVGDYEWWPGYVERITQRGSQLFSQESEKDLPWPLLQSAPGVFFPKGDPTSKNIFMRDSSGKVTHYLVSIPGWPLITARKIR